MARMRLVKTHIDMSVLLQHRPLYASVDAWRRQYFRSLGKVLPRAVFNKFLETIGQLELCVTQGMINVSGCSIGDFLMVNRQMRIFYNFENKRFRGDPGLKAIVAEQYREVSQRDLPKELDDVVYHLQETRRRLMGCLGEKHPSVTSGGLREPLL